MSLHRPNGEELSDDFACVGDIITAHKFVRLRYSDTVAVANGTNAHGNRAYSRGGDGEERDKVVTVLYP
jgi:hypothetical protein